MVYVIDSEGIIRAKDVRGKAIDEAVDPRRGPARVADQGDTVGQGFSQGKISLDNLEYRLIG